MHLKLPVQLAEELQAAARRDGTDKTTLIVELLAEKLGYPLTKQEKMPLTHT